MQAKYIIKCSIPNDSSGFSCRLYTPFHGIGKNGIEGQDDATFNANLALSDKLMSYIYAGWQAARVPTPDGGLYLEVEISQGTINFSRLRNKVKRVIKHYGSKI